MTKIDVCRSLLPSDRVIGWDIKMTSHPNSNASFINIWDRLIWRRSPNLTRSPKLAAAPNCLVPGEVVDGRSSMNRRNNRGPRHSGLQQSARPHIWVSEGDKKWSDSDMGKVIDGHNAAGFVYFLRQNAITTRAGVNSFFSIQFQFQFLYVQFQFQFQFLWDEK